MNRLLERLRAATARREAAGLRRQLRPRPRPAEEDEIDMASNDYLGLCRDTRVVEAAVQAAREWGVGSTGSRLVTGNTALHAELEGQLATFAAAPTALVFSSGYLANLAAVTALSGRGTLVVSDAGNHASLVDACRLSRARVAVTAHRDVGAVEQQLRERDEEVALVVTDAVFSVDGDRAPLGELHAACRRHDATLVVDEAHSLGVLGEGGRGLAHELDLARACDVVRTVTLSKSLGGQGGAVLAAEEVIETLISAGRSFIFDTGLAPASAAAALRALEVLASEPWLPGRVRSRAAELSGLGAEQGLHTLTPEAAVVPVVLGRPDRAVAAQRACARHGVRVGCFRPPSVPEGRSCLRLTSRATLTERELASVHTALAAVAAQ